MNGLKKLDDILAAVIRVVSVLFYVIMLATASLQILMRFIFKSPLAWTDEVSKYAFVWGTMLGCAYLVRTNGHSCVEALGNMLKGNVKKAQRVILDIVALIFYVIVVLGGITLTQAGGTSVTPALGVPMYLIYLIMPISGVLMIIFQVECLLKDVMVKEES